MKTHKWENTDIGNVQHSNAYLFGNGKTNELQADVLAPFYTRELLFDNFPNMRNFGISKHHAILDLIQSPLTDFNNLKNAVPDVPEVEVAYAQYNGTHYSPASGEYNQFYPDMNLGDDNASIAPNKNAILIKGVKSKGLPPNSKTFRLTINMRIRIPKFYFKSKGREYETEIPPIYRWMTKDHEVLLKCIPDFTAKKGSDKTTWLFQAKDAHKSSKNRVHCEMKLQNGKGHFSMNAGSGDMYFVN